MKSISFRYGFTPVLLIILGSALFVGTLPHASADNSISGLDCSNLTFQTFFSGSGNPWSQEYTDWLYGGSAAKSGSLYSSDPNWPSFSYIETYVTGPGHLYFWWKVSCGQDSYLELDIPTGSTGNLNPRTVLAAISGERDWELQDVFIPPGGHILRWAFVKGNLYYDGSNAGWLDSVVWFPTSPMLVVRGLDNGIYYRAYSEPSGPWGPWESLPGSTCDSPAAAILNNELHVVVRGIDGNTLWHSYVDLVSGAFSGWERLDGSTPSAPTLVSNNNRLILIVRGQDNRIYFRSYVPYMWNDWLVLPTGTTCDSPAVSMLANHLHFVVRGMDGNSLWYSNVGGLGDAFSGWTLIDGSTLSAPTLTSIGVVFIPVVRGQDNLIYYRYYYLGSWLKWAALPSGSTPDGPTANIFSMSLHFVVRGMDGNSLWHRSLDLGTGWWKDWAQIDGASPSKPTLTSQTNPYPEG